jgi:hypothetical protein
MTTLLSIAPTASAFLSATPVSANILLPTTGAPTIALVTNTGDHTVFVALGSISVVATGNLSLPIMGGGQIALTIGAATYIAAVTDTGEAGLVITVGT